MFVTFFFISWKKIRTTRTQDDGKSPINLFHTLLLNLKPHIAVYCIYELNLRPDDDTIFGKIILYVVFFNKQIILYIVFFIKKIQFTPRKIIFHP